MARLATMLMMAVMVGELTATTGCLGESETIGSAPSVGAADRNASTTRGRTAAVEGGHDWPVWRGPNGDGASQETNWSADWGADGPPQFWRASVGTGFSSMSVARGRVYTMGHRDGNDTVYCFDAARGEEVWTHSYPCQLVDNLHEGGPACTPTVDGDRVYTVSKEGHFFCLSAKDGSVLWSKQLQALLGVNMPEWGFSCSPLVVGDKVVLEVGRTCAFDKESGELVWQTEKFRPGYGSPTLFQPEGSEPLVTVLSNDFLLVVKLASGEEVDRLKWETSFATSASTPLAKDNTLFISTGYGKGCLLAELKDGQLTKVYENNKIRSHMANCVLVDGVLYGIDGQSHLPSQCRLVALGHATGEVHWSERGFGCGTVLAAGDRLLILTDDGDLASAKASKGGYEPISRGKVLEGKCWTVPVLAHGRLYCRNAAGQLVCLDLRAEK